jgi:TP901-1 family phage major tail protein
MATENKNIRGLEVLIYVNVAEEGQPAKYEPVGGQRGASLSMSADELDITDKNTVGYKKFLVGLKEWSISCDGLVVDGETAYDALFKAFIDGNIVHIQLKKEDGSFGYEGDMVISSMDFDAQYDDALTYSCELKGAGDLTKMTKTGA